MITIQNPESKPSISVFPFFIFLVFLFSLFLTGCSSQQGSAVDPDLDPSPTIEISTVSTESPEFENPETPSQYTGTHTDNRPASNPEFFLGVDLSYVNEMDDCGAVYLENGVPVDAYQLFNSRGANLVRARLWHNPNWTDYSDLEDIKRSFIRANEAGMFTLLDFHYSDNWADPGKQAVPEAWKGFTDAELAQAVYDYTYQVLTELHAIHLMPDYVQVGNETNSGMLKQITELDWLRDAKLFNAGIQAVRDAARDTNTNPKIILHVAQPENAGWWFQNAIENGITDFDIIGLSYYPQWSLYSIGDVGAHVSYLRQTYKKDVLIVETAYLWTLEAVDETADNILNRGIRGYPFSTAGQRQFMVDLSQSILSNGGLGVVYWEPAWVSTECSTRWGQGSHWENATFFDFNNNNEVHEGIEFLDFQYHYPTIFVDGSLEDEYGQALLQDPADDNLDQVSHLDLISIFARDDVTSLYLGLAIGGDLYDDPWGSYMIYIDTTEDENGADIDVGKRPIIAAEPYRPEFRIDIQFLDRKGTISPSLELNAWDGVDWNILTYTGGAAVQIGSPSIIELQISKASLGEPDFVNLGVISTGRGRVHTAGDILGISDSPSDWNEPVILDSFVRFGLTGPK